MISKIYGRSPFFGARVRRARGCCSTKIFVCYRFWLIYQFKLIIFIHYKLSDYLKRHSAINGLKFSRFCFWFSPRKNEKNPTSNNSHRSTSSLKLCVIVMCFRVCFFLIALSVVEFIINSIRCLSYLSLREQRSCVYFSSMTQFHLHETLRFANCRHFLQRLHINKLQNSSELIKLQKVAEQMSAQMFLLLSPSFERRSNSIWIFNLWNFPIRMHFFTYGAKILHSMPAAHDPDHGKLVQASKCGFVAFFCFVFGEWQKSKRWGEMCEMFRTTGLLPGHLKLSSPLFVAFN